MEKIQSIQQVEERKSRRISHLQKILATGTSLIQRAQAKFELSLLQGKRRTYRNAASSRGIVAKKAALVDSEIKRERGVVAREEEIGQIEQELQEEAVTKSTRRRRRLERRLEEAEARMEGLSWDGNSEEEEKVEEWLEMGGSEGFGHTKVLDDHRTVATEGVSTVAESLFTYQGRGFLPEAVEDDDTSVFSFAPEYKQSPQFSRLRVQLSMIQEDTAQHDQSKAEKMMIMDEEHSENTKRNNELKDRVGVTLSKENTESLFYHWEYKTTRLSNACLALEGDKVKQDKAIRELEAWKIIQEERIVSMQQPVEHLPPKGGRPFALRSTLDPSFRLTFERAVTTSKNMIRQIRNESKIEMMAIEEQLRMNYADEADLAKELTKELVMMKSIIVGTYKKKSYLIYQLCCRKCNQHIKFVGTTTQRDLKNTIHEHFDQVVNEVKRSNSSYILAAQDVNSGQETWSSKFAEHFAKHCKPSVFNILSWIKPISEKRIINFCQENVKVEVLRRQDGSALYWEEWKGLTASAPL